MLRASQTRLSGVSSFKGRLMDEIPDAEYKVVEHQIVPPLDPSPRWRFQPLGARHRIRPRAGKRLSPENASAPTLLRRKPA